MVINKSLYLGLLLYAGITGFNSLMAQQSPGNMTGEYYLTGVMETASGFKLNADHSFEFFFSYGALDRYGSGKWKENGKTVVLQSRPRPAKDFALITSKHIPGDSIMIKIVDPNTQILRYVNCSVKTTNIEKKQTTNSEGIANFILHDAKEIKLLFLPCPDRPSSFSIPDSSLNYFEFKFEPWIAEVFFENFFLTVKDTHLEGKHPLLPGQNYQYLKQ